MSTTLIFWIFCVGYPVFTFLQSLALIWLIWRFRNELFLNVPVVPGWNPRAWRICLLPRRSPHATIKGPAINIQGDEVSSLASEVHA